MNRTIRIGVVPVAIAALLSCITPAQLIAADSAARLEGLILEVDGRPAPGYRVHLLDDNGSGVASEATSLEGFYSFKSIPAGRYSMGIENSEGQFAPVAGPPLRVGSGQLVRHDVKIYDADPATRNELLKANYGLGSWWGGLGTAAQVWSVVALVAVVGISAAAISDDDEPAASIFVPL